VSAGLAEAERTLVSVHGGLREVARRADRATGLLLEDAGIHVADAEDGEATHAPNIPDVAPRQTPPSIAPPQSTPCAAPTSSSA